VGLNNRSADTKPHAGAVFLGRKESVEYLASLVGRKSDASVFDRYEKLFVAIIPGAERELTRAIDGLHCVDALDHHGSGPDRINTVKVRGRGAAGASPWQDRVLSRCPLGLEDR
jgi:hypothetical protein